MLCPFDRIESLRLPNETLQTQGNNWTVAMMQFSPLRVPSAHTRISYVARWPCDSIPVSGCFSNTAYRIDPSVLDHHPHCATDRYSHMVRTYEKFKLEPFSIKTSRE